MPPQLHAPARRTKSRCAYNSPQQIKARWRAEGQAMKKMVAPRYMPIGYADAWSPATQGVLTGTPIYIGDSTAALPAFTVIKDFRNYDVRTRHTNADLGDAVKTEDLRQSAVFMAVFAWQAATREEQISRRR
jgi:hypothetical protein